MRDCVASPSKSPTNFFLNIPFHNGQALSRILTPYMIILFNISKGKNTTGFLADCHQHFFIDFSYKNSRDLSLKKIGIVLNLLIALNYLPDL
jgi:hypothetical protein